MISCLDCKYSYARNGISCPRGKECLGSDFGYKLFKYPEGGGEDVSEFEVGDEVKIRENSKWDHQIKECGDDWGVVKHARDNDKTPYSVRWPNGYHNSYEGNNLIKRSTTKKEGSKMALRKCVKAVYKKTDEADVVDTYFEKIGLKHDNFFAELFLNDHKEEIIIEAQRLESEANEKK